MTTNELDVLLMHARAELAAGKVTLADLGQQLGTEAARDAYQALHNAINRLDGTLAPDSQALLAGSDPAARMAAIQPVYDAMVGARAAALAMLP